MPDHESLPHEPGLKEVENALRGLAPATSRLDRDQLFFAAGRARAKKSTSALWPSVAAAMGLLALVEAGALVMRPGPQVVTRVVMVAEGEPLKGEAPLAPAPVTILVERSSPPVLPQTFSSPDAGELRGRTFKYGLDMLPEPEPLRLGRPGESLTATAGRLLEDEINKLMNPGESS